MNLTTEEQRNVELALARRVRGFNDQLRFWLASTGPGWSPGGLAEDAADRAASLELLRRLNPGFADSAAAQTSESL